MLFTLTACSSNDIPDFAPSNKEDFQSEFKEEMYNVKLSFSADTSFFSKNIEHKSRAPKLEEIWFWVDYDTPSPQKFKLKLTNIKNHTDVLSGNLNGKVTADIEFQMGRNAKNEVTVSNGSSSVQVSKKLASPVNGKDYLFRHCMLASSGNLEVAMSSGVATPAGKSTLHPYGDRLFRSHGFTFDYGRKKPKWLSHAYNTFGIYFNVGNSSPTYALASENSMKGKNLEFKTSLIDNLVFDLDRYTSNIQVNFCMVDWSNDNNLNPLDENDFFNYTRAYPYNWGIRTFLSNVTSSFHLVNHISSSTSRTGDGIVSILDNFTDLSECRVVRKDAAPDVTHVLYDISAIGLMNKGDQGEFSIFPMQNKDSKLYITFHAKQTFFQWKEVISLIPFIEKKKSVNYHPSRTLVIPLSDLGVTVFQQNMAYELLVIISVKDFVEAMKVNGSIEAKSRAACDPLFGEVISVPHRLLLREVKD